MQIFVPFYFLLFVFVFALYWNPRSLNFKTIYITVAALFIFYIVVVAMRDFDMQGDTRAYINMFNLVGDGYVDSISLRIEPGFVLLLKIISWLNFTERGMLFAVSILQALFWFVAFKTYFVRPAILLMAVFLFISMFFFYNLGANILRQALAVPFLILALHYIFSGKLSGVIVTSLLAFSFHKTTLAIIIVVLIVNSLNLNVKYLLITMIVITLSSMLGVNDKLSVFASTSILQDYQHIFKESSFNAYRVGFRPDFWLFSMIPVFLYWCLTIEGKVIFKAKIGIYLALFSLFIFMFSLPFSDRTGIYCWTLGCLLMSEFLGYYRFNVLNSNILMASVICFFGILSFLFYPTMNFNYTFERLL